MIVALTKNSCTYSPLTYVLDAIEDLRTKIRWAHAVDVELLTLGRWVNFE